MRFILYHRVWEGGVGAGIVLQFLFLIFSLVLLSFVLSCPLLLFLSDQNMITVVSVSLFFISSFFISGSFNQELLVHRNCCVCHVKLFRKSISDHYSVDFLAEGRVFKLASLFRMSTLTIDIVVRLLDRVYHFSLLICYPCSSSLLLSVTYLFI